jgi:polyphosphate kinase
MCSLRPGVTGTSENIRVVSVVDRYLEHARVFYFHNAGEANFSLASADWMPRNFNRRVEIAFPVLEPALQNRLKEILELQLADNVKGWRMQSDGSYSRPRSGKEPIRFQECYYDKLQADAHAAAGAGIAPANMADFIAPESNDWRDD